MIRRQSATGLVSGTLGMAQRPDRSGELDRIRVPTLVIHGTADAFIPLVDAEAMHRAIVGSRLEVLPGAGHVSNIDSAAAFYAALDAFLQPLAREYRP
jgi:pimeloyl-ACP methyl ester carboxylesterase